MAIENENDDENGDADELWVENDDGDSDLGW